MSYEKREGQVFVNRTQAVVGEDRDFATMSEGPHALGLVRVKNCELKSDWGTTPGYRLVLRSRSEPEAYATIDVTAKCGERCGMSKLSAKMLGKKLNEEELSDPDVATKLLLSFVGKWFLGTIEWNRWMPEKGRDGNEPEEVIFVRVQGKDLMPHPQAKEWGDCNEWFKLGKSDKKSLPSEQTTFEDMPDATPQKTQAKKKTEAPKKTESVAKPKFGPHMYDLKLAKDKTVHGKQISFIKDFGGAFNDSTGFWHFPEKLSAAYEPNYKGTWPSKKEEVSFDDDELPVAFGDAEESESETEAETSEASDDDDEINIPF